MVALTWYSLSAKYSACRIASVPVRSVSCQMECESIPPQNRYFQLIVLRLSDCCGFCGGFGPLGSPDGTFGPWSFPPGTCDLGNTTVPAAAA